LSVKTKAKDIQKDLDVDAKIILKRIAEKQDEMLGTGFI
jgi:hypothetical protein